jgi:hypothetical protein
MPEPVNPRERPLFVVRVVTPEKSVFKAFSRLPDAKAYFYRGWLQTDDGEFDSIAVFEAVGTDNAREAVDAVKRADPAHLRLLELKEPAEIEMKKALGKLNLDELDL